MTTPRCGGATAATRNAPAAASPARRSAKQASSRPARSGRSSTTTSCWQSAKGFCLTAGRMSPTRIRVSRLRRRSSPSGRRMWDGARSLERPQPLRMYFTWFSTTFVPSDQSTLVRARAAEEILHLEVTQIREHDIAAVAHRCLHDFLGGPFLQARRDPTSARTGVSRNGFRANRPCSG